MKATNILFTLSLVLASSLASHAQVGIGTSSPNASAVLDITSTTKGLLPPRMTAAQRNAIATPAQGLMIYCTNCGTNGEPQFYNGAAWVNLVGSPTAFGCGDNFTVSGVTYGTVTGANSKCWLDRNLGATQVATSITDAASYGDYFQWGRGADGHQISNPLSGTTASTSNSNTPGNNFIRPSNAPFDWRSPQNDNLWQGVSGVNNPCPSGYRLPTNPEWVAEHTSWISQNASGAFASPLKLPAAGDRHYPDGSFVLVGDTGYYWSSTVSGTDSYNLYFGTTNIGANPSRRGYGFSVRCIKD